MARRRRMVSRRRETRPFFQLVICSSAFILLVAAKFLIPRDIAPLREKLSHVLEQNMDVEAVFSAVGAVFSGESNTSSAAAAVYQAVFKPDESVAVSAMEENITSETGENMSALETLWEYREQDKEEDKKDTENQETQEEVKEEEKITVETEDKKENMVVYSDLPEKVSLEQAILNFDYCTPVDGVLTSSFGYREHPIEGEKRFHYGVDIAAESGQDILSFASGTVTAIGDSSSYGKYCIVSHPGNISTLYAHCSRITVSSDTEVSKGEKIAEVGKTGQATGTHLHFEIKKDDIYLNPIYYISFNNK